jgi:hypothetical protein
MDPELQFHSHIQEGKDSEKKRRLCWFVSCMGNLGESSPNLGDTVPTRMHVLVLCDLDRGNQPPSLLVHPGSRTAAV